MNKIMKIMVAIMTAIIMLFVTVPSVFADGETNFSVILTANKTSVKRGETVEVIIELGEFSDIGNGINSFLGDLEYDKTKLSIESSQIVAQNGWDTPTYENDKLLTTKGSMITANEEIIKMTFTVNADAELGTTTITVKNAEAANDENDFIGIDGTISIEIAENTTEDDETGEDEENPPADDDNENPPADDGTGDEEQDTPSGDENEDQDTSAGDEDDGDDDEDQTSSTNSTSGEKDNTVANTEYSKAGLNTIFVVGIFTIVIVAVVMYRKNKEYQDIK